MWGSPRLRGRKLIKRSKNDLVWPLTFDLDLSKWGYYLSKMINGFARRKTVSFRLLSWPQKHFKLAMASRWAALSGNTSFTATFLVKLDSIRWFSQSGTPTPHFGDAEMTAKFKLGRDFCTTVQKYRPSSNLAVICAPKFHLQVSSSYVYSFESYRVGEQTNAQTNKQTPLKHPTLFAVLHVTMLGKYVR